jgi:hypothetical protein
MAQLWNIAGASQAPGWHFPAVVQRKIREFFLPGAIFCLRAAVEGF